MFHLIESKVAQFCKSVTEVDWDKDRWCLLRFPNSHATILSVQIFQTAVLSVPEIVFKLQFCHWQLFQTAISVQISYEQILTKIFHVQIFWTTILYVRILFVLHTEGQDGCVITFLLQWHLMHFTPSCLTVMRGKRYWGGLTITSSWPVNPHYLTKSTTPHTHTACVPISHYWHQIMVPIRLTFLATHIQWKFDDF